jgi:SNF2 family DNA or RNA helicase
VNQLVSSILDLPECTRLDRTFLSQVSRRPTLSPAEEREINKLIRKYGLQPIDETRLKLTVEEKPEKPVILKENRIIFNYKIDNSEMTEINKIPGRQFHKDTDQWSIPLNKYSIERAKEMGCVLSDKLKLWYEELHTEKEISFPKGLELYPFQKEGVEMLEKLNGRALLADEMRLGKTVEIIAYLKLHPELRPAVAVVPATIKINWQRELSKWIPNEKSVILYGRSAGIADESIIIINYDILTVYLDLIEALNPKILIFDECFVAGTKISTPNGNIPIEKLGVGDIVYNAIGEGKISAISIKSAQKVIKLILSNNTSITCTPDHLFFTEHGWITAEQSLGKILLDRENILADRIRVERIEILEPRSNDKSSKRHQFDTTVYNLEVEGHPSYYANNILVHNCHMIKNLRAVRTRAAKYLAKNVQHIVAMSGTPITNRPSEFWMVLNMIAPDIFNSHQRYLDEFCNYRRDRSGKGASNTDTLHEILTNTIMIRRLRKEVFSQLPEKQRQVVPMEIDNRADYEEAKHDLIAFLKRTEGEHVAWKAMFAEALVKFEKLKQLAVEGKFNQIVEWIETYIEEEKLMVICVHRAIVNRLIEHFGDRAVKLYGGDSAKEKQEAIDSFQTDEKIRLFVGNIKAAGMGFSLSAADATCTVELDWVPSNHSQAEDRIVAMDKTTRPMAYYLIGVDTIEEEIAQILDRKRIVLDSILDGIQPEEESLLMMLIEKYKGMTDNDL